jgi:tetratricopeptide (TPR) repeat protein
MRSTNLVLSLLLISVWATGAQLFAQAPGEKIYVVNDTLLKSGTDTLGQVTQGNILMIEDARDRWYKVDYKSFGVRGWIPRRDTVPLQVALDQFTADIRNRPTAYAHVGRALIWKDRNEIDRALRDLDAALWLDPRNPSAFHTRGVVWMKQKEWARSIPDFDAALRFTSDPIVLGSAHHNRGIARLRLNEFDKAIADFDACLQLLPLNKADAYAHRGEARNFLTSNLDLALADLNEALRLNPRHGRAWSMRAANFSMRGDWDRALSDYNDSLQLDPNNVAALDNRGVVWEKKGNMDQALHDFDAAIAIDPEFAPAVRHRAQLLELQGRSGESGN